MVDEKDKREARDFNNGIRHAILILEEGMDSIPKTEEQVRNEVMQSAQFKERVADAWNYHQEHDGKLPQFCYFCEAEEHGRNGIKNNLKCGRLRGEDVSCGVWGTALREAG